MKNSTFVSFIFSAVVLCISILYTEARAQGIPQGFRLTWEPNLITENIQWYSIWYRDGDVADSQPVKIDGTNFINDSGKVEYTKAVANVAGGLALGDNMCLSVTAHNDVGASEPSEEVCAVLELEGETPVVDPDPVDGTVPAKPQTPTFIWTY